MDLTFSPEHIAFREEVRSWIRSALPPHLRAKAEVDAHFDMPEMMEWHRVLYKKGWVAPQWPNEHGGPGFDVTRRFILQEELELAGTPALSPFGLKMVGPLLIQFGSDMQKKRFLPRILSGEDVWCQGYSEPNAGSDLASLRLRAEPNGKGQFVLNGQKTWTTYAQYANWIFVLARTDATAKKQQGISFFLADMKTPGLRVRPVMTIAGAPSFCETFFEDVVVPEENLVGPLHGGWTLAKALLGHERTMLAAVGSTARTIRRVKRIAQTTMKNGKPLADDPVMRAKIARLEIKWRALQMANYRVLASAQAGKAPGPESSILKVRGTELTQAASELAMETMGMNSLTWIDEETRADSHVDPSGIVPPEQQWVPPLFNYARATTIYGGSNEIQRNVIAKMILGLPDK